MKKAQPTDLDKKTQAIYSFYRKHRRMPSYSEICTVCELKSKNTAHNLIKKLDALGKVQVDSFGKLIPVELPEDSIQSTKKTNVPRVQNKTPLTLLGLVEAGFPTPSEETLHDNISLDDWVIGKREASFMLKVKGDSMKDAGILDGDMVIVERCENPKVGQIVVADVDGSHTMKYLRKDSRGRFYLEAANSEYDNIYPEGNMRISAVVKAVVRKY